MTGNNQLGLQDISSNVACLRKSDGQIMGNRVVVSERFAVAPNPNAMQTWPNLFDGRNFGGLPGASLRESFPMAQQNRGSSIHPHW